MPDGHVMVTQFTAFAGIAIFTGTIGETEAFGPDAAINHADNDILAAAVYTAELFP